MINGSGWHLCDVLAATGGELVALDGPRWYPGISTDTRRLSPGELFVALRGPNHDGHAFAGEAVRRGAGAVVIERGAGAPSPGAGAASVIDVDDTLRALGDLAAHFRRGSRLAVAAVTGSNGKTTTKEMTAAIMDEAIGRQHVLRTAGTENNLIGVPLTLLRAREHERVAILELGMNAPGEIWRLAEIADPDVGVVTCVGPAHLEGLGSIAGVAHAKGELYQRLRRDAAAVVNGDDARVGQIAASFTGRTVRFGQGAEVSADGVTALGGAGVVFTLVVDGERRQVHLPLPGRHNVTNALAAAAVARLLGASLDAIVAGLARLPRLPMRMEIVMLPGPVTIINDAYNANPASMRSALAVLASMGNGARIAVLGEMRELGDASAALHHDVGRAAAAVGLKALITLGAEADAVRAGALAGGMDPCAATVVGSQAEAAERVRALVRPGDSVLIKGSRGARMEAVLARLQESASASPDYS
jgi:UDP-N-acetylmuramoyl-tripeptide--D-alanyl-D-alanine ligase